MESITAVGIVFVLLVLGVVFLFIARRILRLALKLAFALAIVSVLVIGAGVGWWRGWFDTQPKNRTPAGATNKRATPASRSTR